MRIVKIFSKLSKTLAAEIYSVLPSPGISDPIFIIGCGRSGTTILGKILSKHRDIRYLNEYRHIWFSAYPQTDIWSHNARKHKGQLVLSSKDTQEKKNIKLKRMLKFETILKRKRILVEKTPANSFRLEFLHKIFPEARYIHIFRNGLEVAKSIEKLCKNDRWLGVDSYKWEKITEMAHNKSDTSKLPDVCSNFFDKGLLEWRLSTESIVAFLSNQPKDKFLEINYSKLIDNPSKITSDILKFIGLEKDPKVYDFIKNNIRRRTPKLDVSDLSAKQKEIGGYLLKKSTKDLENISL